MGCDIHGVFQKRADGKWLDVEHNFNMPRHYQLFGVLAGVRNPSAGDPIDDPRGLPADFEVEDWQHPLADWRHAPRWLHKYYAPAGEKYDPEFARLGYNMGDHSHSWLTAGEMRNWFEEASEADRTELAYFFDEVARLVSEHGEIRFVFGFDS